MKAEYTRGPWSVGEYDPNLGYDCMTGGVRAGPAVLDSGDYGQEGCRGISALSLAKMLADAHLIAAAPDLLAEITKCLVEIDAEIEQRKVGGNTEDWVALQQVSDAGHAAIAKATQS